MRNGERSLSSSDSEHSTDPKTSSLGIARELLALQQQLIASVHQQSVMLIDQQQQLIDFLLRSTSSSHESLDDERPTSFLSGAPIRE